MCVCLSLSIYPSIYLSIYVWGVWMSFSLTINLSIYLDKTLSINCIALKKILNTAI